MQLKSEERIMDHCSTAVRRRGAQPGNVNALKHGWYARAAIAERRRIRELLRAARQARRALSDA